MCRKVRGLWQPKAHHGGANDDELIAFVPTELSRAKPHAVLPLLEEIRDRTIQDDSKWWEEASFDSIYLGLLTNDNGDTTDGQRVVLEILDLWIKEDKHRLEYKERFIPFVEPLLSLWPQHSTIITGLLVHLTQALGVASTPDQHVMRTDLVRGLEEQVTQHHFDAEDATCRKHLLQLIKAVTNGKNGCWSEALYHFVMDQSSEFCPEVLHILWNWAIQHPTSLASQPTVWQFLRGANFDASVGAIVGNLVSGAPDDLLISQYDWLVPFLLEQLQSHTENENLQYRIVRTLRCMGPETLAVYAPTTCLGAFVQAMQKANATDSMRILLSQVITPLLSHLTEDQRTVWLPSLQLTLLQSLSEDGTALATQWIAVGSECLLQVLSVSPWVPSIGAFPESFFRQLKTLRRESKTATGLLLYLIELTNADTFFCVSQSILELLSMLILQHSPVAIDMVERIATPQTARTLASNEQLLPALVDVCNTATDEALKGKAKDLVLLLVPEL